MGPSLASIPAIPIAAVTKNTSGGNWADHIVDQPVLRAVGEPYFALPVVAGFFLGGTLGWIAGRALTSFKEPAKSA